MSSHPTSPRKVLLLSGMSGAGLSTACAILRDLGYEVYDNFPLEKVDALLDDAEAFPLALSINARGRSFDAEKLLALLDKLKSTPHIAAKFIFMDSDNDVLRRRYAETRRPHPLALETAVEDGIAKERQIIAPLQARADLFIDTTAMGAPELRTFLKGHFNTQDSHAPVIQVVSFSYRMGIPAEANHVFDMRLLRNPHWDLSLRPKTGQYDEVGAYIRQDQNFNAIRDSILNLVGLTAQQYRENGTHYLTVAFGCTGGKHRSVYMAEQTAAWLKEKGFAATLHHRELIKNNLLKPA